MPHSGMYSAPQRSSVSGGSSHRPSRYHQEKEKKFSATFLIVLTSLLFVAVFGGALVGGVVSGDPSNGFFITIIAASGVAITVAAIVSIRYCCKKRATRDEHPHDPTKECYNTDPDIEPGFTRTADDEDEEDGYYNNEGHYYGREPVDDEIQTVNARSMAPGDISAMSPGTYAYDVESYAASQFTHIQRQNQNDHRHYFDGRRTGPFDFSSIMSTPREGPIREDPPEDGFVNHFSRKSVSRDPSAARATTDGKVIPEDVSDVDVSSPRSNSSTKERYQVKVDEENAIAQKEQEQLKIKEWEKKTLQSKSPKTSVQTDKSVPPPPPPPPPRPAKSPRRSGKSAPKSSTGTPAASEAGSAVSSLILKPFANMFGKRRTPSEAGSEASTTIKGSRTGEGLAVPERPREKAKRLPPSGKDARPPMPGRKNGEDRAKGLETIGGAMKVDKYAASTTGNNSTFSIPPPRHIPSTPGGASEVRSMAASSVFSAGAASSSFDPGAHERALRRAQNDAAALGAAFDDMSIYYEEDESGVTTAIRSAVAPSEATSHTPGPTGYDVFAPAGPLGMVVDTIDKGCVVHSLKKTSPMQGLITPGDMIVALDDIDVRNMDAASLTKLMAKKSQQKERKFTLLPANDY